MERYQILVSWFMVSWIIEISISQNCMELSTNSVKPNVSMGQRMENLTFARIPCKIIQQCIRLCFYRKICHSFNFNSQLHQCELNIEPMNEVVSSLVPDELYRHGLLDDMPDELAGTCLNHDCPDTWECKPYRDYHTCLKIESQTMLCQCEGVTPDVELASNVNLTGVFDINVCCQDPGSHTCLAELYDYNIKCRHPPIVNWTSGASNQEALYFPAEFTYTCLYGYLSGNPTIKCLANGYWNSSDLACQGPPDCGVPTSAGMGTDVMYETTYEGSVATYFCETTWVYSSGSNSSVCQSDGQWTTPTLVCRSTIDCGTPPDPAVYTGTVMAYQSTSLYSTVTYTCKPGWIYITGSNQSTCHLNQTWSQPSIVCAPTTCYVVHPTHGVLYKGTADTMSLSVPILGTMTLDCDNWEVTPWSSEHSYVDQGSVTISGNLCRGITGQNSPVCSGKNGIAYVLGSCSVSLC